MPVTPFAALEDVIPEIVTESGRVRPGFAIAINAEKIVLAQADAALHSLIRSATLRYADGVSIAWTLARRGVPNARIPGCELWEELMRVAGKRQIPVFLIGAQPKILRRTRDQLRRRFRTPIVGSVHGYVRDEDDIIRRVAASRARIVTVAMGSPAQEIFIARCRRAHPSAFYMGVGGSYDILVGAVRRAPKWMRTHGLEWLYRLLLQPTRVRRQLRLVHYLLLYLARRI